MSIGSSLFLADKYNFGGICLALARNLREFGVARSEQLEVNQ